MRASKLQTNNISISVPVVAGENKDDPLLSLHVSHLKWNRYKYFLYIIRTILNWLGILGFGFNRIVNLGLFFMESHVDLCLWNLLSPVVELYSNQGSK